MYQKFGKRLLDLSLTLPAVIVFMPVLVMVGLLIYFKLGSPVFFRQQRPGKNGQPFTLMKFRTMINAMDGEGRLLPDSERLPPLGQFLRRSSLDELPELFNVLKGEMSLVGPRPLLIKYLSRYSPEQIRRQDIKPGLTGWAQVNGRNALTWEERLRLDVWYVDHSSFLLDLKIILITFWKVIQREGISEPGQVTMSEFTGQFTLRGNGTGSRPKIDWGDRGGVYSPEFKAQVVLDVLSGVRSTPEICREHSLEPYLLARWQAEFVENAAAAFRVGEQVQTNGRK